MTAGDEPGIRDAADLRAFIVASLGLRQMPGRGMVYRTADTHLGRLGMDATAEVDSLTEAIWPLLEQARAERDAANKQAARVVRERDALRQALARSDATGSF